MCFSTARPNIYVWLSYIRLVLVLIRVLHAFWLKGGGGHFSSQIGASRFFTNNMVFLKCGVNALFEAFYMFRDHNHVKMKF